MTEIEAEEGPEEVLDEDAIEDDEISEDDAEDLRCSA